jgi:hypothetical protein
MGVTFLSAEHKSGAARFAGGASVEGEYADDRRELQYKESAAEEDESVEDKPRQTRGDER